jgi:hypothetical protein
MGAHLKKMGLTVPATSPTPPRQAGRQYGRIHPKLLLVTSNLK